MRVYTFYLVALMLLFVTQNQAQIIVTKNSGDTIHVEGFRNLGKKIELIQKDKNTKIPLVEIKSIVKPNVIYIPTTIGKKKQLLTILSYDEKRVLGLSTKIITRNRGGFEIKLEAFQLDVIENNQSIAQLKFTDGIREEDISKRAEIVPFITANFKDCQPILEHLKLFDQGENQSIILQFFKNPTTIKCE